MPDLVVTCPKNFFFDWIAEGDAAGEPPTGEEWAWFLGGARPDIGPGDRLYVVAWGWLRGFAPCTRLVRDGMRWAICRRGDAEAVTIAEPIPGFRGWRRRWWDRSIEVPFPEWRRPDKRERVAAQFGTCRPDSGPAAAAPRPAAAAPRPAECSVCGWVPSPAALALGASPTIHRVDDGSELCPGSWVARR